MRQTTTCSNQYLKDKNIQIKHSKHQHQQYETNQQFNKNNQNSRNI